MFKFSLRSPFKDRKTASLVVWVVLVAATLSVVIYVMANSGDRLGPPYVTGGGGSPLPTSTPAPTATPQPTATPGGGFTANQGLAIDAASTPTSSNVSGVPNVDLQGSGSAFPVAGDTYYEPFTVDASININRVSLERTDANPAQDCSVGIYTTTNQWQPLALEVDFSPLTLAGGGAAWNHKAVNYNLPAGSYLAAYLCNGAPLGTFPGVTRFSRGIQNTTGFGVTFTDWRATTPSISPATPFPSSPAAGDLWDNFTLQGTADNGYWRLMFRWTVN